MLCKSSLHVNNKNIFYSALDTGKKKKTAAYCANVVLETIKEVDKKCECRLISISIFDKNYFSEMPKYAGLFRIIPIHKCRHFPNPACGGKTTRGKHLEVKSTMGGKSGNGL